MSTTESSAFPPEILRDVMKLNEEHSNFRVMGPDETSSNRLDPLFGGGGGGAGRAAASAAGTFRVDIGAAHRDYSF